MTINLERRRAIDNKLDAKGLLIIEDFCTKALTLLADHSVFAVHLANWQEHGYKPDELQSTVKRILEDRVKLGITPPFNSSSDAESDWKALAAIKNGSLEEQIYARIDARKLAAWCDEYAALAVVPTCA